MKKKKAILSWVLVCIWFINNGDLCWLEILKNQIVSTLVANLSGNEKWILNQLLVLHWEL